MSYIAIALNARCRRLLSLLLLLLPAFRLYSRPAAAAAAAVRTLPARICKLPLLLLLLLNSTLLLL
jgi:hypothetical protein